jgi:hypothetical protein
MEMDNILELLLNNVDDGKRHTIDNLQDANTLVLKNTRTNSRKLIEFTQNFKQLLNTLTNNFTGSCSKHAKMCADANAMDEDNDNDSDDITLILPSPSPSQLLSSFNHDWVLEVNYFSTFVRPFVHKQHYDTIKNYIDFNRFIQSETSGHANVCMQAGDYYYWPNICVFFFGWRLYLHKKFAIDINPTVPLVHNKTLGAVNLFVFEPPFFLNIEMSLRTDTSNETLFVNGRHKFDNTNDVLFVITMTDETKATCRILDEWTYSNKNFFDYIRDDINLQECRTVSQYCDIINVNLQKLRVFDETINNNNNNNNNNKNTSSSSRAIVAQPLIDNVNSVLNDEMYFSSKCTIVPMISASSENADLIQNEIDKALLKINESIIKVLVNHDRSNNPNIVQNYLEESKFMNFDYIIFVVWKMLTTHESFDYRETDIKLFLELLCETIFEGDKDNLTLALDKCQPYVKLERTVFNRLCNHWTFFNDENPYMTLGYFFGIHYLVYLKLSAEDVQLEHRELWAYTYENVLACDVPIDILCKGYLKKLEVSSVNLIFNGKNYDVVKKEDELYKLTSKVSAIRMSGVKFNNWKYLYFTGYGMYNVFTNDFHSSCPFVLGTTLPHSFKKPTDKKYLHENVFDYMMKTSEEERNIFRVYHIAKMCRDVKMLKTEMALVFYLGKCVGCQTSTRTKLDVLFRELWNLEDEDLITLALYLKEKKVFDILHNFKCNPCRSNCFDEACRKKCKCYRKIKVNRNALKIALIVDMFGNDTDLCELMWTLVFNTNQYVSAMLTRVHSEFVDEHAHFFLQEHTKLVECMYKLINKIERIDMLMEKLANKIELMVELKLAVMHEQACISNDPPNNLISNFYLHHSNTMRVLLKYNVWWDKIILAREKDDLSTWLTRFYMRVILSKLDLKEYAYSHLKKIVQGYLYFKRFTNFNHANSMMMIHFAASLGIPSDYGKKVMYLPGKPGAGKSSFFELLDHIILLHKHDCNKYTLSSKETDEMEVNKLTSQLYVINEMKMCNDSFFKSSADSSKSDSKCRKYQGGLKYEANYKLLVVNNNPLYIIDYDKAVHNRFVIVYTDHVFVEDMRFAGSIYEHIKSKRFPAENVYYEALVQPVRLFLSHVLMYKRDTKYGFVQYKNLLKNDPIHKHNLLCLDTNNSPLCALIYILNIRVTKNNCPMISENKMEEMICSAVEVMDTFLHPLFLKCKNGHFKNNFNGYNGNGGGGGGGGNKFAINEQILMTHIKEKYANNYNVQEKYFFNITMALTKKDMNINVPTFKC